MAISTTREPTLRNPSIDLSGIAFAVVAETPESRMKFWLGKAARKVRDDANLLRSEIAGKARVSESVIINFEQGKTDRPRKLDRILDVYAELGGLKNRWSIWRRAIDLAEAEEDAARAGQALQGVAQATRKARGTPSPRPDAGKSRGAGGRSGHRRSA